ncbi:hypothetical protein BO86DRAFT_322788 [Aspergillus japonicus CBS 114.51]|uniref:Uncharacterized protein n=1 Tax=Aspergillus japonicus CBS 114.51 TaxID=1448312 RepID=A0A8T8WP37_ASPJA|nr:hypothetical protein BO86DRAFT_322788 [Aspergillus japonicus CBS 114.51]RAH77605.1 hypothetical protein BO86DRAFT_322788 [Aspergillus japonicus CBS 114.51]
MALTNLAIIVIMVVCCLAVTALGAGLASFYSPPEEGKSVYEASAEQQQYMRSVRLRALQNLEATLRPASHA